MNVTTLLEPYRNESILNTASLEWGEWMRVLSAWCSTYTSSNDPIDINTLILAIREFHRIHEKIHHRVIFILICTVKDPNSIKDIEIINDLNNQFLEEQKKLDTILRSLQIKNIFWIKETTQKVQSYMKFVSKIIEDINLDWSVLPSGWIIFDPADSLSD